MIILEILVLFLGLVVAAGLAYHYFLLIAGKPRPGLLAQHAGQASHRFALVVPAHNEAETIAGTIRCMQQIDYPVNRFDVHVVADHCSDATAQVAGEVGAEAHVRGDEPRGRKGFAVDWAIKRLLADPRNYDAIAVFDADSLVDAQFLHATSTLMDEGAAVVQGHHIIANPDSSLFSTLADADMRLNNRIRNQAKENLGLSARLMGDGMVFRRDVLAQNPWIGAESLTEDRDYGIYLVTQGIRIRFASDAKSFGQAVTRWKDATPQRLRWYGGAFDLQRRYLHTLWSMTWRHRNGDALDKLLELALPPFSMLAMASVVILLLQLVLVLLKLQPTAWLTVGGMLVGLAVLFPFLGLLATHAPARAYEAMVVGPVYVLWRVWIGIWVRLRYRSLSWVRTRRVQPDASETPPSNP